MFENEPVRWVGFLVALGVLLPLALWFVADALPRRARDAVVVLAVLTLVAGAAQALSSLGFVGLTLGSGFGFFGESQNGLGKALLGVLGLAIGLAVSTVMLALAREDAVEDPGVVEATEDEPTREPETIGDERWSTHTVERLPATSLPADSSAVTLALVALGLAIPVFSLDFMSRATGIRDTSAPVIVAYLLAGVTTGLAVLLPALALRRRSAVAVGLAFGIVALGTGIGYAWPDTLFNETWQMIGAGLTAGLLLPAFVRVLPAAFVRDTTAIAAGVLAAAVLVVGATWLLAEASKNAVEDGIVNVGTDLDVDNDNVVQVPPLPTLPPLPTYPGFPSDFPSDFPSFSLQPAP